jgi:hypothetical protein
VLVFAATYLCIVKKVCSVFVLHENTTDCSIAEWSRLATFRGGHCRTVHSGPRISGGVRDFVQYQQGNTDIFHSRGLIPVRVMAAMFTEVLGARCAQVRFLLNFPSFDTEPMRPDTGKPVWDLTSYRTGDLSRYWLAATLEFLAQDDCQVKTRGNRIALYRLPGCLVSERLIFDGCFAIGSLRCDRRGVLDRVAVRARQQCQARQGWKSGSSRRETDYRA